MDNKAAVTMVRAEMRDIPQWPPPAPYSVRTYRPGDEETWIAVEQRTQGFARAHWGQFWERDFAGRPDELADRMFFLCAGDGAPVGTITAWYGGREDRAGWGRIHWVAIVPEGQGRGLSRSLMTAAMNRLARSHPSAWLSTDTTRRAAIQVYLRFGFAPEVRSARDRAAWRTVREQIKHPALDAMDLS